jgi:integrase
VSGTIDRFSPRDVPQDLWRRVEPAVKESVTKVGYSDAALARKGLSIVAQLAIWADRIGHPVDTASLFTPEFIDRFITEGCAHLSGGTRLNYRSQLWRVGAAVVGHRLFPPRAVPLHRSELMSPYSKAEVTELVSWSKGRPTSSMRRDSWALLALGLGTGMRSEEITRAVGRDIREENGIVLVDVLGPGGRINRVVPVHHLWAGPVMELAYESGDRPYFRPDRTRILRGDVLGFIRRCAPDGPPKFNVQRLRITWLVGHLAAGTHLAALEEAAGVAVGQLVKYLAFAAPLSDAEARAVLVGRH